MTVHRITNWITRPAAWLAAALFLPATLAAQGFDHGPELEEGRDYYATLITNHGKIHLELYGEEAPRTVQNFVNLAEGTAEFRHPRTGERVKRPFYNGLTFHRVIPDFMIQGGDPLGTGSGGPGYNFEDEFHPELNFDRPGLLAMANSGPNTNGSQFFITESEPTWLNQRHTIFGGIVEGTDGLDVVRAIARVDRDQRDRPRTPVVIEHVKIHRLEQGLSPEAAMDRIEDRVEEFVEEEAEEAPEAEPEAPEAPEED